MTQPLIGGIEAGGTTFRCAVATHPFSIVDSITIDTVAPAATLDAVCSFFERHAPVSAIGIGSFGPIDVDPASTRYGTILDSPKLAWQGTNILDAMSRRISAPCTIDTDVVAAARAEARHGGGQDVASLVYLTIGTGIGGAALVGGTKPPALFHAEMGHTLIAHDRDRDPFAGVCPFHGDCLEGLASAPALKARWQAEPDSLPDDHPAWDLEAHYLGLCCVNLMRTLAPERILLGGGVMQRRSLLPKIQAAFETLMGNYHTIPPERIETVIQHAALEPDAGLIGALTMAADLQP